MCMKHTLATEENGRLLEKPCMFLYPMTMETGWKKINPLWLWCPAHDIRVQDESSRTNGNNFCPRLHKR